MRRAACLLFLALTMTGCGQGVGRGADDRLADADRQERSRQEKVARDMVAQTEDQVRVKILEQRIAALEAQVAAMQGDRKLLDAQLVEQRLDRMEATRLGAAPAEGAAGASNDSTAPTVKATPSARPGTAATPAARKPLVLDLR